MNDVCGLLKSRAMAKAIIPFLKWRYSGLLKSRAKAIMPFLKWRYRE